MLNKYKYLKKEDRKKVLFLCDDIRTTSGIATMAREIVIGTAHHFNWATVGAAINHPEMGKRLNLSDDTNKHTGLEDSDVVIYPFNGYGTPELIRMLIKMEKPDALFFFTDPRYYVWLFEIEQEIRQQVPFIYLNIWDSEPAPLYNKEYYRSCDALLCISKQTEILVKKVLGKHVKDKLIAYVPHGINHNHFYPILPGHEKWNDLQNFKKELFKNKDYEFVLLFNSRNIRRKSIPDTLMSFKLFLDKLPEDKKDKCAFVLHTQRVDENGTDLNALVELLFGENHNIIFSDSRVHIESMNLLYNACDCGILLSSNEGWGLSVTEALMCGSPVVANVTGGIQDQARFQDDEGNWIRFTEDFNSNHFGKYKDCGEWFFPVFPNNISLQGSVPTPYITDDRVDFKDAADRIFEVYSLGREEIKRRGLSGREWVMSDESKMNSENVCKNIIDYIDYTIDNWKPRKRFDIIKVEKKEKKYLKTPLSLYE